MNANSVNDLTSIYEKFGCVTKNIIEQGRIAAQSTQHVKISVGRGIFVYRDALRSKGTWKRSSKTQLTASFQPLYLVFPLYGDLSYPTSSSSTP